MSDKKQFISKWSNWWSMSRDGKALTEAFAKELDDIIISSRSASPQQGTEGAEEVLEQYEAQAWEVSEINNPYWVTSGDAIKAMHQFAASQVEAALASLVRPELVVPSEDENVLAEEFLELVAMAQRMQDLYRNGRYGLSDKELLDITDYLSEIQSKKPQ